MKESISQRQINLTELRERSVQAIDRGQPVLAAVAGSPAEAELQHLVEGLRIYQTELEIQNQELVGAQSALSLALEKSRALFAHLPLPGIIVDDMGFIVEANDQACHLFGLRPNVSRQRRSAMQLFDSESRSRLYGSLRGRANPAVQTVAALRLQSVEGDKATCDVHVVHLHDESRGADRTLLVLVDQSAEIALRDSGQRFRDFSNTSADWFWEMDADLRFSYLSDNFRRTLGLDPHQVLGRTRRELLAMDDLNPVDAVSAHLELLDRHEPFRDYEYAVRDEASEIRWISITGLPVLDTNGRFAGYRGVGQNITALKEREARLSSLIAAMEDLVIVFDTSGKVDEYIHPSHSARSHYQSIEHCLGKNYCEFLPLEVSRLFDEAIAAIMLDGQPRTFEYSLAIDDQDYVSRATLTPLLVDPKCPTGFLAVVRDITNERALQQQVARLEKLNAALQEDTGEQPGR